MQELFGAYLATGNFACRSQRIGRSGFQYLPGLIICLNTGGTLGEHSLDGFEVEAQFVAYPHTGDPASECLLA
jgi:hypothetical protein